MRYEVKLNFKCSDRNLVNEILEKLESDNLMKLISMELHQDPNFQILSTVVENTEKTSDTSEVVNSRIRKPYTPLRQSEVHKEKIFTAEVAENLEIAVVEDEAEEIQGLLESIEISEDKPLFDGLADNFEEYLRGRNGQGDGEIYDATHIKNVEVQPIVEKRGRGRPPKEQTGYRPKGSKPTAIPNIKVIHADNPETEVKRGRGRPPKAKSEYTAPLIPNDDQATPVELVAQELAAVEDDFRGDEIVEIKQSPTASIFNLKNSSKPLPINYRNASVEVKDISGAGRTIGFSDIQDAFANITLASVSKDHAMHVLETFGVKELRHLPIEKWQEFYSIGERAGIEYAKVKDVREKERDRALDQELLHQKGVINLDKRAIYNDKNNVKKSEEDIIFDLKNTYNNMLDDGIRRFGKSFEKSFSAQWRRKFPEYSDIVINGK